MTLSSLLSHDSPAVPNYNLPPVQNVDRTHWGGGGGGWKGGKGNPNAALSALTLLAFLFFLNILQSCLRDTIGQNNGMMVMVLPANSTATTRSKREVNIDKGSQKEDSSTSAHQNWTDIDITNLVHTQVESYWSNKGNRARKIPLNILQTKSRISTKLILNKEKDKGVLDKYEVTQTKPVNPNIKYNVFDAELKTGKNTNNQLDRRFWTKTIKLFINNSIPYIKKIICCSNIACRKEENLLKTNGLSRDSLIRKTMSWICNSTRSTAVCGLYSSECQN